MAIQGASSMHALHTWATSITQEDQVGVRLGSALLGECYQLRNALIISLCQERA